MYYIYKYAHILFIYSYGINSIENIILLYTHIYIYIYVCVCVCVHSNIIYIYICIYICICICTYRLHAKLSETKTFYYN